MGEAAPTDVPTTTGGPTFNSFVEEVNDMMLIFVLCSFSLPFGKYFLKKIAQLLSTQCLDKEWLLSPPGTNLSETPHPSTRISQHQQILSTYGWASLGKSVVPPASSIEAWFKTLVGVNS